MAPKKNQAVLYTADYFNGNSALKEEWRDHYERAKQEDPPNLRKQMSILQSGAWKTSAITSDGTLMEWIQNREAMSGSAIATHPVRSVLSG